MYDDIPIAILTNKSYTINSAKNILDACTKKDDKNTYVPNFNFSFSYSKFNLGLKISVIRINTNDVRRYVKVWLPPKPIILP